MEEAWKTIEGFPDYEVSTFGQVRSNKYGKSRILKYSRDKAGYLSCMLDDRKFYRVHRLVAKAFIPPIEGKNEVDHINRIKHDNYVTNLRWATRSQNCINKETKQSKLNTRHITLVQGKYYSVRIVRNYKMVYSKAFSSLEEAIAARDLALKGYASLLELESQPPQIQ